MHSPPFAKIKGTKGNKHEAEINKLNICVHEEHIQLIKTSAQLFAFGKGEGSN